MTDADSIRNKSRRKIFPSWLKMFRVAALLWPHSRGERSLLALGGVVSVVAIGLKLAQPWPLKWVVDSLSDTPVPLFSAQWEKTHLIAVLSLLYIVVSVLAVASQYLQQLLLNGLGNRMVFAFRNRLFTHLLNLSLSFHDKHTIGEMVTRVVSDTSRLRRGVNGILIRTLQVVFTFLASVAIILKLDWRMALILGVCGALAMATMSRSGRKILRAARKNRRREGQVAAIVAEDLHGIQELQTFRPSSVGDGRFERKNAKSLREEQKVRRLEAGLLVRMETLLSISICLIIWFGAHAVREGDMSLGTLVLFIHYATGLYGPFRQFAQQASRSGRTLACAERLVKIVETEPAVRDLPGARPLATPPDLISFNGVSYKTTQRRRTGRKWVLNDLNLEIHRGERIAVVGKNGAGKSSLLKLLLRLADPHEGRIMFDGIDMRSFTLDSVRSRASVVFQDSILFGLTVRENISLGHPDAGIEEVREVIRRCGLEAWIEGLRDGYDTIVRRQGMLFSGGERQKLALARAMLRNGELWLLDEPTNELDSASREAFTNLLLDATRQRTTVWVTHDHQIIRSFDRVLMLDAGSVGFFGPAGELPRRTDHRVSPNGSPEVTIGDINDSRGGQ